MTEKILKPKKEFIWTKFYMEFANKLLQYKDNRKGLLDIIRSVYDSLNMNYPFMDHGQPMDDICPFTVFGCFNKGITNNNRIAIITSFAEKLGIGSEVPADFDGIPVLNNMKAWFFGYEGERGTDDILNLWNLFEAGINYADNQSGISKDAFIECYNKTYKQLGVKWNITMGLYWMRPYIFINLDGKNRMLLLNKDHPFYEIITKITKLKDVPNAEEYLKIIDSCKDIMNNLGCNYQSFPELSYGAWLDSDTTDKDIILPSASVEGIKEKHSWIYAPGDNSSKWDEFYEHGIMGIGWDEMGDLKQYADKEAMRRKMKSLYGEEYSYKNSIHATWQFANELQIGDVIYAKKGMHKIIGRGVVISNYIFDSTRDEYKHICKVKWTNNGEWLHPGQAVMKTLTDISSYIEYVEKLENLFIEVSGNNGIPEVLEIVYDPYTQEDFLSDVFMDLDHYNSLIQLLRYKKNLILQGAPGVGKTFAAKRLAYSLMGVKDSSRVMMIQFHQSYSYEDFIMGFRPNKDGFELTSGPFYDFCKKALEDEREHFFIIDEINRGNISKIFGELLMLIENDKRNEKMRLLYSNELFSVPKNVHIIGMMNTADRGLSLIDYALRRRFAFFEIEPAFDSDGFNNLKAIANNPAFDALVERLKELNNFISKDESLGKGFRIGHSYLCVTKMVDNDWIEAIIKYELLPLINEYWFDEPEKVEQWKNKLSGVMND